MDHEKPQKNRGGRPKKTSTKNELKSKLDKLRKPKTPKEELESIAATRVKTREKYPWDVIQDAFLNPELDANNNPVWLNSREISERFKVPLASVKGRVQKFGWIQLQLEAEGEFWKKRKEAKLKRMAQRLPDVQEDAFEGSARTERQPQSKPRAA